MLSPGPGTGRHFVHVWVEKQVEGEENGLRHREGKGTKRVEKSCPFGGPPLWADLSSPSRDRSHGPGPPHTWETRCSPRRGGNTGPRPCCITFGWVRERS